MEFLIDRVVFFDRERKDNFLRKHGSAQGNAVDFTSAGALAAGCIALVKTRSRPNGRKDDEQEDGRRHQAIDGAAPEHAGAGHHSGQD
ncbi:hypothetical protein, partial [Pandoraea sp. NPDC087047]|uniref:hypothetical protein n=1 Tax=Pandoraea sp. NPDC087047 TaxID=3364390 RepID=UPI00380C50AC